jgi:hypothetical protein
VSSSLSRFGPDLRTTIPASGHAAHHRPYRSALSITPKQSDSPCTAGGNHRSDVIPWEDIKSGEKIDWNKFWEDAKASPVQFGFELFAIAMMLVGVYVVADWAFELGKIVGRSI